MRVLICSLASPGFLYPAVRLGLEARALGHDVMFLTDDTAPATSVLASEDFDRAPAVKGRPFDTRRWFQLTHLVDQQQATCRALQAFRPDVLVASVLCLGAQVAALRAGVPSVSIGMVCDVWAPLVADGSALGEGRSVVRRDEAFDYVVSCAKACGIALPSIVRTIDDATRVRLVRGQSALLGKTTIGAGTMDVGPLWWEPEGHDAAADDASTRQSVYVHLTRSLNGSSLAEPIITAQQLGYGVTVELGRSRFDPDGLPAACVLVREPVMWKRVLRADLVISHGTSAPVLAALQQGKPLALYPTGSEQPMLTEACRRAGVLLAADGEDWLARSSPAWQAARTLSACLGDLEHRAQSTVRRALLEACA